MNQTIRRIFAALTPAELAAKELADAERRIMEAHSAKEYAESVISYNTARITRLRSFLSDMKEAT